MGRGTELTVRKALPSLACALAAALALAAAGPGATGAEAARLSGLVASGSHPLAHSKVKLYRTVPHRGAAVISTTRANSKGRFGMRYRPRLGHGATLYLIVSRGRPPRPPAGRGRTTARSGSRLAAVLGTRHIPGRVVVDELTTVAAGYAMAQFVHGNRISGRRPGPQNAARMAANIADPSSGRPSRVLRTAPNGDQTSTLATVGSLANAISGCARAEAACPALFRSARPRHRKRPTGVLQAVADIARFPTSHVKKVFGLSRSWPTPYSPALGRKQAPDAWTVVLRFDGDGHSMNGPGNFEIDGKGHIWTLNNYEYAADPFQPVCGSDLLLEFGPDGRYVKGSPHTGGGISGAGYGIAIAPDGHIWVGNYGFAGKGCEIQPAHDSVSEFTAGGLPLSPDQGYTQGPISWPQGTAADRRGDIWVANCGNDTVTEFPGGEPSRARSISGLGLEKPFDTKVGRGGRVFVSGVGSSSVAVLEPDGTPAPYSPVTGGGINRPMGLAVDSHGNVWVANSGLIDLPCPTAHPSYSTRGGSLSLLAPDGRPRSRHAFTGGGLTVPWGITVDGNDNVWVGNFGRQRLSEFCGAGAEGCPAGVGPGEPISPDGTGYGFDGLARTTGLAVDPSGNVWVTNNWKNRPVQTNPGGYQILAYVGAAGPMRTPVIGPPR